MEGDCPNGISMGVLSHRIYYGNAIAQDLLSPSLISRLIAIHSLDPSLFSRLIAIRSLDPSLFSRLIAIRLLDGQGVGRGKWGGKEIV